MRWPFVSILIVSLGFLFTPSYGQSVYQNKSVFNAKDRLLIEAIRQEGKKYSEPLPKNHAFIAEYIDTCVADHIEIINEGGFIKDQQLDDFLNGIVDKLVATKLVQRPFKLFVERTPSINAFCTPIGSLIVNNGLLARLNSEEQLTFIIAHELAHWELEHLKRKIVNNLNAEGRKDAYKAERAISTGKISVEKVREIRHYLQAISGFSREMELEADSLAFLMTSKLRYDPDMVVASLDMLDSGYLFTPYYGSKLFKPLDFEKFPFKTEWVTDESNREFILPIGVGEGLFSTHPEISIRKEKFESVVSESSYSINNIDQTQFLKVKHEAKLEDIACAYDQDYYLDQALYYALRLKVQEPSNSYVNYMIALILFKVSELKEIGMFLIRNDLSMDNKELSYINTFLNNISEYEALEIAFYFINQKENFDPYNQDQYKLLYDLCGATNRFKMQEVVKTTYQKRFRSGKYLSDMY